MSHSNEDRVLALAGIMQAASLVGSAAHTRMVSQDSFEATIGTLFVFDPASTLEVYGSVESIRPGLKLARTLLSTFNPADHVDTVRYTLSMMAVERSLARRPDMIRYIGTELQRIQPTAGERAVGVAANESIEGAGTTRLDDVVQAVATLYQETFSTLEPRIRIMGNRHHLQNETNVARIRALLLAGIRSAVLWQQVGGRRRQLLLSRKALVAALDRVVRSGNDDTKSYKS